jgi:DNA polymerase
MALELDSRQRAMLQEMGVQVWLPASGVAVPERELQSAPASVRAPVVAAAPALAQPPTPVTPPTPQPAVAPAFPVQLMDTLDWQTLAQAVQACRACSLCAGRSHVTLLPPTQEHEKSDWMVLGDPPDEDEDRAGAPFAGQDGVLLGHMLRALGLQRANPLVSDSSAGAPSAVATRARRAYVSNVLKCRVHHGAMPQGAELIQCSAWLQREIALVQPKVILSMGRFANQLLLGESPQLAALPLGKLRGTVHRYQGVAVVVSYPPKLLMRNSADKAKAWADLCLAAQTVQAALEAGGH